jgi:hypothetical protein
MTLAGEVVAYVEPPSRSRWAEPNPDHDYFQVDEVDAVAEAAAEVVSSDVDAELAELVGPRPDANIFTKWWSRGVRAGLLAEGAPGPAYWAMQAHLGMIGAGTGHTRPLWQVNLSTGVEEVTKTSKNGKTYTDKKWIGGEQSKSSMMKGTTWLVEHGWLLKKGRGYHAAGQSRPAEYTIAQKVYDLSEKPVVVHDLDDAGVELLHVLQGVMTESSDAELVEVVRVLQKHPSRQLSEDQPVRVSEKHPSVRVSEKHPMEISQDLNQLASSGEEEKPSNGYTAVGAQCDTCGGPVTTNPATGAANPQCRVCYHGAKTAKATASDHVYVMKSLISKSWGYVYGTYKPDDDALLALFGGDQAAVDAAKSLRFSFGKMKDREIEPAWRMAYAEAGGRS